MNDSFKKTIYSDHKILHFAIRSCFSLPKGHQVPHDINQNLNRKSGRPVWAAITNDTHLRSWQLHGCKLEPGRICGMTPNWYWCHNKRETLQKETRMFFFQVKSLVFVYELNLLFCKKGKRSNDKHLGTLKKTGFQYSRKGLIMFAAWEKYRMSHGRKDSTIDRLWCLHVVHVNSNFALHQKRFISSSLSKDSQLRMSPQILLFLIENTA